jgi:hypothetical protein
MTIPSLSTPPDAPQRGTDTDEVFRTKADAFMAYIPTTMKPELDAMVAAMNLAANDVDSAADDADAAALQAQASATAALAATTYVATSSSSLTVAAGSKTVHTAQAGRSFAVDDRVVLVSRGDPAVRLYGDVTVSDGSDDYTVVVDDARGSGGPYTDWIMFLAALEPAYWSTVGMIWAATALSAAVSPKTLADSVAWVTLTYAATLNVNLANGFKRYVVLTGSPTIAAPTGLFDGAPIGLKLEMGSGGGSPSWNSIWDFGADGPPTFAAGLGKVHYIDGEYDAGRTKIRATYFPPA